MPLTTIDAVLPRSSSEAAGMASAAGHYVLSVDGISAMKMSPGWILNQLQQHPDVEHIIETAPPASVSLLNISIARKGSEPLGLALHSAAGGNVINAETLVVSISPTGACDHARPSLLSGDVIIKIGGSSAAGLTHNDKLHRLTVLRPGKFKLKVLRVEPPAAAAVDTFAGGTLEEHSSAADGIPGWQFCTTPAASSPLLKGASGNGGSRTSTVFGEKESSSKKPSLYDLVGDSPYDLIADRPLAGSPRRVFVSKKPGERLGMTILRESGQTVVRVGKLTPGGPIHRTQCIHEGDIIIQVDGTSTEGMDYANVLTLLRQVGNAFALVVIATQSEALSLATASGQSGGSHSTIRHDVGHAEHTADGVFGASSLLLNSSFSDKSSENSDDSSQDGVPNDLKTRVVVIKRSSALVKLGLTVRTVDALRGARITKLAPGSPCDVGGSLSIGTVIVKIDGEVVLDLDHAAIVKRLQQAGSTVRLVIVDPPRDQTTRTAQAESALGLPNSSSGTHWQSLFSSPALSTSEEAAATPIVRFMEQQQQQQEEQQQEEQEHEQKQKQEVLEYEVQPEQRAKKSPSRTRHVANTHTTGLLLPPSSRRHNPVSFTEGPYADIRTWHIRETSKLLSVPVESSVLSAGSSDAVASASLSGSGVDPSTDAGTRGVRVGGPQQLPPSPFSNNPRLTLTEQLEAAEQAYKASQGISAAALPQTLPAPITVARSVTGDLVEPTPGVGAYKRVKVSRMPGEKLGLKIRSFLNAPGVYVSEVTQDGACFRSRGIGVHDTIVEVNGNSVRDMQYSNVLQMLQASGTLLELALAIPATNMASPKARPLKPCKTPRHSVLELVLSGDDK